MLAVKYRPQTFTEVCGQNITTQILQKVIETRTFKNVYLFAGKSGCGKTTCARIFAKAINNDVGDPIEIDAASNNGVDNVRAIIESSYQRSLVGEYKIYIIDECHSLTSQAWQAFLKLLEEPPKYTIFIFCTTEPNKIPQTILNRMQRFNFSPVSQQEIRQRLEFICERENYTNYSDVCDFLSKFSNGCVREAIQNLEQLSELSSNLSLDLAKQLFSGYSYETMFKLTWALQKKNEQDILSIIETIENGGQNLKQFIDVYLSFTLDLLKYSLFRNLNMTNIPEYLATDQNQVVQFTVNEKDSSYFSSLATKLLEIKSMITYDSNFKSTIEVMLINIMRTL